VSKCGGCGFLISCPGGCGKICLSDCTECVAWCEPAEPEWDAKLEASDGSVDVKVFTNGLGPDSLRNALQAYIGTPLEWELTEADMEPFSLEFSGSVDELLNQTGLRRAEPDYAA
jgi:hypothetical protein